MSWLRTALAALLLLTVLAADTQAANVNDFLVWNYYAGGAGDTTVDSYGRLYVPSSYDPSQSYPLIIFFHGIGEAGTNNTSQVNSNIDNLLRECKERQVFLSAPQSAGGWWPDWEMNYIMAKLTETQAIYNINADCIYVTGLSAGGAGVYNALEVHGNRLAAAVCICGAGGGDRARDDKLVGKPIWFYHAANDPTVGVSQTRNAINGIRAQDGKTALVFPLDANPSNPYYNTGSPYYTDGSTYFNESNIQYTEYDVGGHGIWGRVYNEEWMYDWLLAQSLSGNTYNQPPFINVGADHTLVWPTNTINLLATVTDDGKPEPSSLTCQWSQQSGPGTATIGNIHSLMTIATFSQHGTYVLRLTATDGERTTFDELTVEIKPEPPHLDYEATNLGGGLTGFTFHIHNEDGLLLSYATTVAFEAVGESTIRQVKAFGAVRVDREEDATNYGAMPAASYVKAEDTWVCTPFSNNGIPGVSPLDGTTFSGFVEGPSDAYYMISAGSGSGSMLGDEVPLIYVVCDGNVSWSGAVARAGTSYAVSGVTETAVVLIPGDYNGDGCVDLADYTVWADHYGQTGSGIAGDGNNDGVVDLADYTVWADHYGQGTPAVMTVSLSEPTEIFYGKAVSGGAAEGDFNGDGFVDQADYTLWADGDASADANGDGVVDLADYTIWADNL